MFRSYEKLKSITDKTVEEEKEGGEKKQLTMKAVIYKDRSGELYSDVDGCTLGRPRVLRVDKL